MKIKLLKGDITKIEVDVIVNAANSSLLGGSGVDGAIHRNGGPAILEECQKIRIKQGKCKTGDAVITTAGNLPAKKVIHTVGPVYQKGENNEKELLAMKNNLQSIAFPNISTGIFRFPKQLAAEIAIKTIKNNPILDEVIFVYFDDENFTIYKRLLSYE